MYDEMHILIDNINQLDDKFCRLLHDIEDDQDITEESWSKIDDNSSEIFYLISIIKEYLILHTTWLSILNILILNYQIKSGWQQSLLPFTSEVNTCT